MTEAPKDYLGKGNELLDTGDYKGAIQCYKKALELDPKYAPAWNNKGNALLEEFISSFYDNGFPGLTLACYRIILKN